MPAILSEVDQVEAGSLATWVFGQSPTRFKQLESTFVTWSNCGPVPASKVDGAKSD